MVCIDSDPENILYLGNKPINTAIGLGLSDYNVNVRCNCDIMVMWFRYQKVRGVQRNLYARISQPNPNGVQDNVR